MRDDERSKAFCSHLRGEHRRIEDDLRRVMAQCEGEHRLDHTILPALAVLRDDLADHFLREQEGGCLDEAVAKNPAFGPQVDRLHKQHPLLLAELNEIITACSRASLAGDLIYQRLDRFCDELRALEHAESRLLEEATSYFAQSDL